MIKLRIILHAFGVKTKTGVSKHVMTQKGTRNSNQKNGGDNQWIKS